MPIGIIDEVTPSSIELIGEMRLSGTSIYMCVSKGGVHGRVNAARLIVHLSEDRAPACNAIPGDRAVVEGGLNRASAVAGVMAVSESAGQCPCVDVEECLADSEFPGHEVKGPDAGKV